MPRVRFPIDDAIDRQHEGSEHLAINDSRLRRFIILLALRTTARFFSPIGLYCVPISRNTVVKVGPYLHLAEAATLKFISENTNIPVPKVLCSFVHKRRAYIVMERVRGDFITVALQKSSPETRERILSHLRQIIQELRSIQPPSSDVGVESCTGGSLRDARNPRSAPRFGPFATIQDFHKWLRHEFDPSTCPERKDLDPNDWPDLLEMVKMQDGDWPPPICTHGDLNPFNILVDGDRIAALVDWECAGWYPHYWEYTSAYTVNLLMTAWRDQLDKILDPMPAELKMEHTRQKWWSE